MTTLTEFLLARIAEDEREWGDGAFAPVAGQGLSRLILKTRAECDAKRRIVELHAVTVTQEWVNPTDGPAYYEDDHTCAICGWVPDACDTVKLLTLPYADHPDYRQEWKP